MLEINSLAPDFKLKDQDGKEHSLKSYSGKWLLLYFYPRDNTPGCTKEACELRDNFSSFKKFNAIVLGVSTDKVDSHKKFADKFKLPFPLLADEEKKVVSLYNVWGNKKFMGKDFMGINRTSFLISPQGKIIKIYEKVKPPIHAQEVLQDLKNLT
jgi:thioredoxin-dependent peroxiredoxin